jgi:hypothetical protein
MPPFSQKMISSPLFIAKFNAARWIRRAGWLVTKPTLLLATTSAVPPSVARTLAMLSVGLAAPVRRAESVRLRPSLRH